MDGRHFDGQQVIAYIATGDEKFKKSSEKKAVHGDDSDEGVDGEETRRLDQFGEWLETEGERNGRNDSRVNP